MPKSTALFVHDGPIYKDKNGVYCGTIITEQILSRYFPYANKVLVLTRVVQINKTYKELNYQTITDSRIEVHELDNILSIKGLLNKRKISKQIEPLVLNSNLIFLRLPGVLCNIVSDICKKNKKQYLAEVGGCAWDAYWNHGLFGKIIAPYMEFCEKRTAKRANFATYVTQKWLQNRYPNNNKVLAASDAIVEEANKEVLANRKHKIESFDNKKAIIGTIANVNVRYKGQQYIIKAISKLNKKGIKYQYELVGGGDNEHLKRVAKKYKVEKQILFKGALPHKEVLKWLDNIDIYAQPSKQEGLPRSIVEAISRGVPVIGSSIAGIPELIDKKYTFKKGCVKEIVRILEKINKNELDTMSAENYNRSKLYDTKKLSRRIDEYYSYYSKSINDKQLNVKKIVLFTTCLTGGGAERVTSNIANFLHNKGYRVEIITLSDIKDTYKIEKGIKRIKLSNSDKNYNKIKKFNIAYNSLKQYVVDNQDVYCYISMIPICTFMITSLRKFTKAKIIISERNNPSSYGIIEKTMAKYSSQRCDKLIVQTAEIANYYKKCNSVHIIPNAYNNTAVNQRLKMRRGKIVAVGRLEKQKNYPLLLAAIKEIAKDNKNIRLEIYGKGSQKDRLVLLAKKYNISEIVSFMGYVDDVNTAINDANLYILTSNFEGIPNSLIEAMCLGIPCIATDCDGGGAKTLIENEVNGILVDKNNLNQLVQSINKIINNDEYADKLRKNASLLRKKLSYETIYSKWEKAIIE